MSYIAGMFLMNMDEEVRMGLSTILRLRDEGTEHYIGLYTQQRDFSVSWWERKKNTWFFLILWRIYFFSNCKVFKPKVTEIEISNVSNGFMWWNIF